METASAVVMGAAQPPQADATPAGSLQATPFELMRALSGRRSVEQIRAYDWSVDPAPYLPAFAFGPFTTRTDPLDE
jgi:hypothetical protein